MRRLLRPQMWPVSILFKLLTPPELSAAICKGKEIKRQQTVFLSLQISFPCEVPPFPPLENGDGNDLPHLISVYSTWLAPRPQQLGLAKNGKSSARGFYLPWFWKDPVWCRAADNSKVTFIPIQLGGWKIWKYGRELKMSHSSPGLPGVHKIENRPNNIIYIFNS